MHTIDLEPFKYGGTNITGIRFFNPDDTEIKNMLRIWTEGELATNGKLLDITEDMLHVCILPLDISTFPIFSRTFLHILRVLNLEPTMILLHCIFKKMNI